VSTAAVARRGGAGHLWPRRKRCLTCNRCFGFDVIEGKFCAYECAGRPRPSDDPEQWPREHYVLKDGRRMPKRSYRSLAHAEQAAGRERKQAYLCDYCGTWHIGSVRV
jgi:hypothetical protein